MKKNIWINTILIFLISFPIHFLYGLLPCFFSSIFAPVNESIFEHIKMIFTSILLIRILIYFIQKKQKEIANNYILKSYLGALFNIILFLIFYLPIYYLFGENLIVTLILYFISILITEKVMDCFFNKKLKANYNLLGLFLIVLTYFLFTFLSYNPIQIDFFYDPMNHNYGILKK